MFPAKCKEVTQSQLGWGSHQLPELVRGQGWGWSSVWPSLVWPWTKGWKEVQMPQARAVGIPEMLVGYLLQVGDAPLVGRGKI